MSLLSNALSWLKKLGRNTDASISETYTLIEKWKRIYANKPEWSSYQTNGLTGLKTVHRKLTASAKTMCAELASLIWSEQPQIEVSDAVAEVLKNNKFYDEMQKNIEYFSALGGMAVKGYYDGEIKIDFVTAERFVPLSYDSQTITDAQFLDNRTHKGKKYVRIESYFKTETGYTITNELFNENDKKVPLNTLPEFADLEASVDITTDKKLFHYVKYPIANNFDLDSPMGLSMFANSLSSLEALDTVYDLVNDEVVLGRKRIIVPDSAMKTIFDPDRESFDRFFDTNDRVYQALHFEENETYKITDNSVEIRIEQLQMAVDVHLRFLEKQMGFSPGSFSFDFKEGFKTATEVISDNSKTFKTKQSVENQIDSLIMGMFEIIGAIAEIYGVEGIDVSDISVQWDDSVIEDRNSKAAYQITLKNSGLQTTVKALMAVHGLNEADATKMAADIKTEKNLFIDSSGVGEE